MLILMSGAGGFIGSAMVTRLRAAGHRVRTLVRRPVSDADDIFWNPSAHRLDLDQTFDAVIHLAGENVAGGRWTAARKQRLWSSRVQTTQLLCERLTPRPPRVFIGASAIGFYGDRGPERLDERSSPGQGFLADLSQAWEKAAVLPVSTRCVHARFGIVLGQGGGALKKMLPAFRAGVGATLGSGQQYCSWIALEDVVGGLMFALQNETLSGAANFVSPEPVTNAIFTQTLARVLHRPAWFRAPVAMLRLALGEMAEIVLASERVEPKKLTQAGYRFLFPTLSRALLTILN